MRYITYWDGSKMSWLRYMTLRSLRHYNPNADIYLYYNDMSMKYSKPWNSINQQDFYAYMGPDYSHKLFELDIKIKEWTPDVSAADAKILKSLSPVHRSDIFRWWELAASESVYFDMDILFVQPLDNIIKRFQAADMAICHGGPGEGWYSIGFLYSAGHNKVYRNFYETALKSVSTGYQSAGTDIIDKLCARGGIAVLKKLNNGVKIQNIPMQWFYNKTYRELHDLYVNKINLEQNIYGIHWYAGHPTSQEWNNRLTEESWQNYDNTITSVMRSILC